MKNILYIISRAPSSDWSFPEYPDSMETTINVIFIQQAVNLRESLTTGNHFFLKEDINPIDQSSSFPSIDYRDMLRMIFEANTVISI